MAYLQAPYVTHEARNELRSVVTIAEAEQRWKKTRKTLMIAIDKGGLVARRSAGTYLISVTSLTDKYGDGEEITDWGIY